MRGENTALLKIKKIFFVQDRLMDFNITEYKIFIDTISGSTLQ